MYPFSTTVAPVRRSLKSKGSQVADRIHQTTQKGLDESVVVRADADELPWARPFAS